MHGSEVVHRENFIINSHKFLNNFAVKKRNNSQAKIIAITGSAGKTSLKNLIKNLLQTFGETSSSPKSYNNHFGVPLSLSHLKLEDKFAVLEVGMSKAGEINRLSRLIKPHIGIITNVGEAHIENFKNLRGIADAKGIKSIVSSDALHKLFELAKSKFPEPPLIPSSNSLKPLPSSMFFLTRDSASGGNCLASTPLHAFRNPNKDAKIRIFLSFLFIFLNICFI